ncbi:hypothetical protein TL16_g11039 [Triparma laevis f. inornata]|nr:hypothetical protein TL16_g11039 [Triparma laevis f. inornata]
MPVVYELGASIKTPYGFGICIATGSLTPAGTPVVPAQIKLRSWTLANSKNPSLYTFDNTWDLILPDVEVGCDVMTPYGRGRVLKLEDTETDVYTESPVCAEVILTEWRLANNSRVRCYLNFSDLSYLPPKKFGELSSLEKIETANSKRESAKEPLSCNDLDAANALYTQACFYLQTIDNDTLGNNYDRACLLECMIACKNNGAMCCVKLKR